MADDDAALAAGRELLVSLFASESAAAAAATAADVGEGREGAERGSFVVGLLACLFESDCKGDSEHRRLEGQAICGCGGMCTKDIARACIGH